MDFSTASSDHGRRLRLPGVAVCGSGAFVVSAHPWVKWTETSRLAAGVGEIRERDLNTFERESSQTHGLGRLCRTFAAQRSL
jgi:hypothetical protein